ncbi:MAG: glycosyltransferase family 4 protein [Edaphobacter sp.]|nr:glycosyltransferase family 4 protein [Edaphobacter sp.]
MRVALIASPFITVPPRQYGGTELFIADLAEALMRLGVEVSVYTNGQSTVDADVRWCYAEQQWPLPSESFGTWKEIDHTAWAVSDAQRECDIIHISSALAVPFARLSSRPFVCTLHHPCEPLLTELYERNNEVTYVSISRHQASLQPSLTSSVVHHGVDIGRYPFVPKKQPYLCFLGRICPIKGTHHAIEIARRVGLPLKIAGEIQPIFKDYFETEIRPFIDGDHVEFMGEADLALKREVLSHATALLFPISWNEPFGLVMIEAMACGTPVIAFPGGAVEEVVKDGVSGRICRDVDEATSSLMHDVFDAAVIRCYARECFSAGTMAKRYYQIYSDLLGKSISNELLKREEATA